MAKTKAAKAQPKKKTSPTKMRVLEGVTKKLKTLVKPPPKSGPCISKNGHAKHLAGLGAADVCIKMVKALKGAKNFPAIRALFPELTENQVRYRVTMLKDAGQIVKRGNREHTLYQAAR